MKRNLVKAAAVSAVLAMSVTLFAGCGGNKTAKDDQGRTILRVGGWPDKEGTSLDNMNARKEAFEKANTDVVIEPDYWSFDRKTFAAKAAGGQLPTVYTAQFTDLPEIIASGYSADLSKVLSKRGYDGMFNESILDLISDDEGKICAFPIASYALGLAVNTELFEQAGLMEEDGTPKQPKTWDEVAEFAVQIKEKTGKPGFVFPTSSNVGGWIFNPVAWSYGVDFMEKDSDGKWQATFDTPECAEALQFIKDLKWKYDVLPANTIVDYGEMYKVFATGGAGMLISAGDGTRSVVSYGMTPDQFGIVAFPEGPKKHVTLLGGDVVCVKEDATEEQIDAAVRWIESQYNYKLTDDYKENQTRSIDKALSDGQLIGVKHLSPWSMKAESLSWLNGMYDSKANSNPNHVKLYNDFVLDCPAEIRPEEPVCAQELYQTLDGCIQEVLTNKDADCAKLLKQAVADFQSNYLDNLTY